MGAGLSPAGFMALVQRAAATPVVSPGAPRRLGDPSDIARNLDAAQQDLHYVLTHRPDVDRVRLLSLELGSCLYDAGAPHPAWRFWTGLAGLGLVLLDRPGEACPYLVLAEQWESVARLTSRPAPDSGSLRRRALWALAGGKPVPEGPFRQVDEPWADLLAALPAADQRRVSRDLRMLADFWIGEDEGWNEFLPRSYPSFEPEVCAAAAIARRRGLMVTDVPDDVLLFLEPGLGVGVPEGLPTVSPR